MNQNEQTNTLHVNMYGGLSMYYGNELLTGDFRDTSQFSLLMATILSHRRKGTQKELLVQTLFDEHDIDDISHSLRNALYNAKKKLREMGLPDVNYFRKEKNFYFWTSQIPVELDSDLFQKSFYRALQLSDLDECVTKLLETAHLYTGEYLPHMQDIPWIIGENHRLRDMFRTCIWEIELRAQRLKRFEDIYHVALYAAKVDPFAQWEVVALKALIAMDRYDEAEKLFDSAIDLYAEEFGGETKKEVRELRKELGRFMMYKAKRITAIQAHLNNQKDEVKGGYVCPFPVFRDLYQGLQRIMMRNGEYVYLMSCTILDHTGKPVKDNPDLEDLSYYVLDMLVHSIRHTDTVTQYGKNQFLILLIGTSEENCSKIQKRIGDNFAKEGRKVSLAYEVSRVVQQEAANYSGSR